MTRRNRLIASCAAAAVIVIGGARHSAGATPMSAEPATPMSAEPATPMSAEPATPMPAALTQLDHISIQSIGSGPSIFLIPGLSSPRAVFDRIAPVLAAKHTVHLVQVNGFAGDDPRANDAPGILEGIVADLDGFIADRKLKAPAIAGHSMGGLVAMMLAAHHPDRIGRLMIIDALPFFGTVMGAPSVEAIRGRAETIRSQLIAAAGPAKTDPVTVDPGGIWSNTPAGRIRVANWSRKADPRVVAQAIYEDMTTDMRPELAKITARPFTVLYAAGMGEAQARAIWEPQYAGSGATLVAIPESYHFIMLDQPAAFAAAMASFLGD